MDLAAPQYCQVCLFSEINEQMAHKPATGHGGKRCVFLSVAWDSVSLCVCGVGHVCPCMLQVCACVCLHPCEFRSYFGILVFGSAFTQGLAEKSQEEDENKGSGRKQLREHSGS